jgi:hypothetical protein
MERAQTLATLMSRVDDIRRLALDELDAVARKTNTWGSPSHRAGRDRVEQAYDQDALRLQRLEDAELEQELAKLTTSP